MEQVLFSATRMWTDLVETLSAGEELEDEMKECLEESMICSTQVLTAGVFSSRDPLQFLTSIMQSASVMVEHAPSPDLFRVVVMPLVPVLLHFGEPVHELLRPFVGLTQGLLSSGIPSCMVVALSAFAVLARRPSPVYADLLAAVLPALNVRDVVFPAQNPQQCLTACAWLTHACILVRVVNHPYNILRRRKE